MKVLISRDVTIPILPILYGIGTGGIIFDLSTYKYLHSIPSPTGYPVGLGTQLTGTGASLIENFKLYQNI
jgi:hypothetical protein